MSEIAPTKELLDSLSRLLDIERAEVKRLTAENERLEKEHIEIISWDASHKEMQEKLTTQLSEVRAERDEANLEVEDLTLKLAGCGVAAMQNTISTIKDRLRPGDKYYCASYGDVCRAVDREMIYRDEVYELKKAAVTNAQLKAIFQAGQKCNEEHPDDDSYDEIHFERVKAELSLLKGEEGKGNQETK